MNRKPGNIERSTFNIQRPKRRALGIYWRFDVECLAEAKRSEDWWMLNVSPSIGGMP
jgi:hypothetical protein